ncbi:MAG TPA: TonB-dependent receptor [Chitinophagales bacterium]|nr:TonB-dependent receptor [Chitinophagales bacterium]
MKTRMNLFMLSILFPVYLFAAENNLFKGKVNDANGQPVIGASVQLKGTNLGTTTDLDGLFSFAAEQTSGTLIISYVGFNTLEKEATANVSFDIVLIETPVNLNDVMVVGTRSLKRTAIETAVPIDIIQVKQMSKLMGQTDVNQLLQYVAPSFNSNKQSGADGADHIDPATLRGLGPDQTLVLINGKRLHQTSLINLYGTRGRGNTGTDLNTIPASAIERIEVLRDGASAQYGSDAIAGVMNIVLKSNPNEFTGGITVGANVTGYGPTNKINGTKVLPRLNDGVTTNININYGWRPCKNSFVNFTIDVLSKKKTFRPNNTDLFPDDYRKKFGEASNYGPSIYLNSSFGITDKWSIYSFGGFNFRNTDAFAYTRDAESARNVTSIYPDGFDPHIQSKIYDGNYSLGAKGKIKTWELDLSNTFGINRMHYFGDGTLNASLEDASPTRFDDGGFQFIQNTVNLGVTKNFEKVLKGLNFAAGTEYRLENYQIFAGEEASWKTYGPVEFSRDSLFDDQGNFTGFDITYRPGGSQGFPGFRPTDEVNENRHTVGLYTDVELDVTKSFLIAGAIRYEYYNDFGHTVNFKFATRYKFGEKFTLRGSVSSGFRAPSLAQIYFQSTFTDVVAGNIVDKVISNNKSDIVKALGIPSLKQEKSLNGSFGFTARPADGLSITADGYYVGIKDRIVLTGAFSADDPDIGPALTALNVGAAQFFTNALDTKTFGVDLVIAYNHAWKKHNLNITFAGNYNKMLLGKIKTSDLLAGKEDTYFGIRDKGFLLASAPRSKFNLAIEYKVGNFSIQPRINFFDKVELINYRAYGDGDIADAALAAGDMAAYNAAITDVYKPRVTLDLSMAYDVCKNVSLVFGSNNLLDAYPTAHDMGWSESGGMWDAAQMGFGGMFLYGKVLFNFKDNK